MKPLVKYSALLGLIVSAASAQATIITVNTEDNTDFSAGKTNLVKYFALLGLIVSAASAQATIITVNTEDNTDFTAGKTNLVKAISLLGNGDTIRFNISGSAVHYIQTPVNGYPLIT